MYFHNKTLYKRVNIVYNGREISRFYQEEDNMTRKRRIFAAVTAVLLVCSMLFTSCDKLSVKNVEKDPFEQTVQSTKSTASSVVESCTPFEAIGKALTKGSVSVELDNEDIGKLSATLWNDADSASAALKLSAEMDESTLSLGTYFKDGKLAVESAELFDGAYGADIKTLADDIKDSDLLDLMGVSYDDIEDALKEFADTLNKYTGSAEERAKNIEELTEKLKKDIKDELNSTDVTVAKEKIETGVESNVNAVTVTYSFDEKVLYNLCEIAVGWYVDTVNEMSGSLNDIIYTESDYQPDDIEDELDYMLDEIKNALDECDLDITLKLALNPKTTDIMRAELKLSGEIDGEDGELTGFIDLGKEPAKSSAWTAEAEIKSDLDTVNFEAKLTRTDDKDTFSRELTLKTKYDDIKEEINAAFKYDKNDKKYTLSAKYDETELEVKGGLEYSKDSFTMSVDTVEVDGEKTDIGLKITAKVGESVPNVPEFKNVFKLSKDELEALSEEISENAETLDIISSLFGTSYYPDYDYEYDYDYDDNYIYDYYDEYDGGDIYAEFNETYDYDFDGDCGDSDDYAEWQESFAPFGIYDGSFDYDGDGDSGDDDDRAVWEFMADLISDNEPLVTIG